MEDCSSGGGEEEEEGATYEEAPGTAGATTLGEDPTEGVAEAQGGHVV